MLWWGRHCITKQTKLLGAFLLTQINFPAWIDNYTQVWDDIIYPFPNFKETAIEVWKWISYFIPQFTGHVITYPYWDQS